MADNSIQSVQKLLQDLIAPDVRETKARLESLEKRMEARFDSMDRQFESTRRETDAKFAAVHSEVSSLRSQMEANFSAVLSAIGEMKAHAESLSLREVASLRERIAVLEVQQRPQ